MIRIMPSSCFFRNMSSKHLYGVKDGKFYTGAPPENPDIDWVKSATEIGSGGWGDFQHLFFHPDGTLYGVLNDKFYKGAPPSSLSENWVANATQMELYMALKMESFTRVILPRASRTTGLDLPNLWEKLDGPFSNSSSLMQKVAYTGSKMASFINGVLPQVQKTTG